MKLDLPGDDELQRSAVIANCRMNRERGLTGSNGYGVEIGVDPLDFLSQRLSSGQPAAWLDLCCGSGKALIVAAEFVHADGRDVEIVRVDLVGMLLRPDSRLTCLQLAEASLSSWRPYRPFDLITCVHGLHYLGDKLGAIARAASWLTDDGLFVASIGLHNLRFERLVAESEAAHQSTSLPETPSARPALNDLLLRMRL